MADEYYNSNSNWFQVDWGCMTGHGQSQKAVAHEPEVLTIRQNTALNRNYRAGNLLEDGRVKKLLP